MFEAGGVCEQSSSGRFTELTLADTTAADFCSVLSDLIPERLQTPADVSWEPVSGKSNDVVLMHVRLSVEIGNAGSSV